MSAASAPHPFDSDFGEARRLLETDEGERRILRRALATALALHAALLWVRFPRLGPAPVRVDAPAEVMQVQFLEPPPRAPQPKPPEKKIARPDPKPEEPEPVVAPEAPPPDMGPVRVAPGQGPGLVKRVQPVYPPLAQAARIEGTVVLDAVILTDGSVHEITVLRSASPILEKSAVEALEQWRFTEGDQDVIMTLTVHFVLR